MWVHGPLKLKPPTPYGTLTEPSKATHEGTLLGTLTLRAFLVYLSFRAPYCDFLAKP